MGIKDQPVNLPCSQEILDHGPTGPSRQTPFNKQPVRVDGACGSPPPGSPPDRSPYNTHPYAVGNIGAALAAAIPGLSGFTFERAGSAYYEDYAGIVRKYDTDVPVIAGVKKTKNVFSLVDESGNQLHPYGSFTFNGKTIQRLAKFADWEAATAYAEGRHVAPGDGYYYESSGGTSGGVEPVWAESVVDNDITWTRKGIYQDLIGLVVEPGITNKSETYSFPPADELQGESTVNGDFSAWTGDNPDGWSVTEVGDATSNVTEDSGKCRIVSDGTAAFIQQTPLIEGRVYDLTIDIDSVSGLGIKIGTNPNADDVDPAITTTGTKTYRFTAMRSNFIISRVAGGASDTVIDNVSLREVKNAVGTYANAALPTNIDGFTWTDASGLAKLSIVEATEAQKAKFADIEEFHDKMYYGVNPAGSGVNAVASGDGFTDNLNNHSASMYAESVAGTPYMIIAGNPAAFVNFPGSISRIKTEDVTVDTTTRRQQAIFPPGSEGYFAWMQMEEYPSSTSTILTSGATGARASTNVSFNVLEGNDFTVLADVLFLELTTTRFIIGDYTSPDDRLYLQSTAAGALLFAKRVSATTYQAFTVNGAISAGETSRVAAAASSVDGICVFDDGTKGAITDSNTSDMLNNEQRIGSNGAAATASSVFIKNLFVFHATEADANMQTITDYDY